MEPSRILLASSKIIVYHTPKTTEELLNILQVSNRKGSENCQNQFPCDINPKPPQKPHKTKLSIVQTRSKVDQYVSNRVTNSHQASKLKSQPIYTLVTSTNPIQKYLRENMQNHTKVSTNLQPCELSVYCGMQTEDYLQTGASNKIEPILS